MVKIFQNPRRNAMGGFDADIELNGALVPYTLDPETEADQIAELERANLPAYVAPPPPPPPPPDWGADLSPSRFEWLLAYTGLGDVWAALETATKDTDRATFATLRAQRAQPRFRLGKVLAQIEAMGPIIAQIAPGVDLSEAAIRAAWKMALEVEI